MSSRHPNTTNCLRTQTEVSSLIKELRQKSAISYSGPHKSAAIDAIEQKYATRLPSDYRQFLTNYGLMISPTFSILGLKHEDFDVLSLEVALDAFRLADVSVPAELCPVQFREDRSFACLVCNLNQNVNYTPVVVFKLHDPRPVEKLELLAGCFRDYLYEQLRQLKEETNLREQENEVIDKGWEIFEEHVREYHNKFDYDHAKGGKLPRNHDWRPYRYCIQDVLFGANVVRHLREANCLQVDVFLTADIPEYGPLAGAMALASFLLSEAYKCGGTMEIRFTKNVEGGQVPQELQDLARQYEIVFSQANAGKILPEEAKALYAALTDFPPSLQQKINELEQIGRMKMARACYVVNHGMWSKEQVEMIVLGSEQPDSVLSGRAQPHQRHLYFHDLLQARAALLGGMLDRILAQRQRVSDSGVTYDMEDDVRPLEISFDGELYAKQYHSDETVPIPWLYPDGQTREITGGMPFNVLVRARDAADLQLHLAGDLKQATDYRQQMQRPTLLLIPNDFMILPDAFREKIHQQAQTAQIGLMVCPDPILTFDAEAAQKLARSRILRQ